MAGACFAPWTGTIRKPSTRPSRRPLEPCGRPTLICCKTVIGRGSPALAGTHDVHGAPLGADEAAATRQALGWQAPPFEIPQPLRRAWDARAAGALLQQEWDQRFARYRAAHPELAAEFQRRTNGTLPADFAAKANDWISDAAKATAPVATRKASQQAIAKISALVPELLGGSADLTGSNLTDWPGCRVLKYGQDGNYIHYGVREFGMAAVINGIALHGGFVPFGGTFLVFSDYARNALRLAALMRIRSIFVFTHDSIGLGEDGPTHQPVEHLGSLRLIPNLDVWRPCDVVETAVAWRCAVERDDGPSAIVLTRQNTPQQKGDRQRGELAARGGYVLADASSGPPDVIIIATGSEVSLAMQAREQLATAGIAARVVSMPSTTIFDRQNESYRRWVLPEGIRRLAVEAAASDPWWKYVGLDGEIIGIDRFGESAPGPALFTHFGFTAERIAEAAARLAG